MKQRRSGFTLVELIIAIAILAVLSTVGFVSFSSYGLDARNTTRASDMGNLEVALREVKQQTKFYPRVTGTATDIYFGTGKIASQGKLLPELLGNAATKSYVDPKKREAYAYSSTENGREYQIAMALEGKDGNPTALVDGDYTVVTPDFPSLVVATGSASVDVKTNSKVFIVNGSTKNFPYVFDNRSLQAATSLSDAVASVSLTGTTANYSTCNAIFDMGKSVGSGSYYVRNTAGAITLTGCTMAYSGTTMIAMSTPQYTISNSLRFRSGSSAYLSRTPVGAGDRQKMTYSFWMKRGSLGGQALFWSNPVSYNGDWIDTGYSAGTTDTIDVNMFTWGAAGTQYEVYTNAVFRDPSSWYHVVVAIDTTQSASSDRIKIYVNGVRVSTTSTAGWYPPQNFVTNFNNASMQTVGARSNSPADMFFDGYLTDVHFIDGQALAPTNFGQVDSITGQWIPKQFAGTYWTNGFRLDFSSGATAAALGTDVSGKGNNWTVNNMATTDQMIDTPTNNFIVMNPLDVTAAKLVQSNGNLSATQSSAGTTRTAIGSVFPTTGKWYYEGFVTTTGNASTNIGVAESANASTTYGVYRKSGVTSGLSWNPTFSSYAANDVIGVGFDAGTRTVRFYKNGTLQGTGDYAYTGTDPVSARVIIDSADTTGAWELNFGQGGQSGLTYSSSAGWYFKYAPPAGFKALSTANLPTPSITNPNQYFDVLTWIGNGSSQSITGLGFQPSLVWKKSRTEGYSHIIQDSVRGLWKTIQSNTTNAEQNNGVFTSFDPSGFTLNNATNDNTNGSAQVAWCWKAGGPAVSNTSGTIASQVSANPAAGFSIVAYSGTLSSAWTASVGHWLGSAPKFIITKSRNKFGADSGDWTVWHSGLATPSHNLVLNQTVASTNSSTWWTRSLPDSSVFWTNYVSGINVTGNNYIAYAFSEVPGFSKFGTYTGNGSTDGPFAYTGFRPKYVMIKRIDSATVWVARDSVRDPFNSASEVELHPSDSNSETTNGTGDFFDMLSNGFKLHWTWAAYNASGWTYIYAAFAEAPFGGAGIAPATAR